jgi:hypothetical protein
MLLRIALRGFKLAGQAAPTRLGLVAPPDIQRRGDRRGDRLQDHLPTMTIDLGSSKSGSID